MYNDKDAALKEDSDEIQIDFYNEDYEECLYKCSKLLLSDTNTRNENVNRALYVFIEECCTFLLGKTVSKASSQDCSCSFCGKSAPDVRLGAGHSAFICNECVDIFSQI